MSRMAILLVISTICGVSLAFDASRLHDVPVDPCKNGAEFIDGKCECLLNFRGDHCENKICENGGRPSHDSKNGYTKCICPKGVTGTHCELRTYCAAKGTLVDGLCVCEEGWTGSMCHLEEPCHRGLHRGDIEGNNYTCECEKGYEGPFCEKEIDCNHGFVNDDNKCTCTNGFSGEYCDECEMHIDGDSCKPEVYEESLIASPATVFGWPSILIIVGIAVFLVGLTLAAVFAVRSYRSKPSRVSSAQGSSIVPSGPDGTDV